VSRVHLVGGHWASSGDPLNQGFLGGRFWQIKRE